MLSRIRRVCFRLLYNEFAFTYDVVSHCVGLGHWRSWQRSVLTHLPSPDAGPVLELAHGTGDLQLDLLQAGYETVALDLSRNMGRLARRKLLRKELHTGFVRGDALALPFRAGSFPSVVCTFPTPFIVQPDTLRELNRVLLPGGQVVTVLAGQLHGKGAIRRLIRLLYRLTGQGDGVADNSALGQLFQHAAFAIETRVVSLDGSAVQLAILTKTSGEPAAATDLRLENDREP